MEKARKKEVLVLRVANTTSSDTTFQHYFSIVHFVMYKSSSKTVRVRVYVHICIDTDVLNYLVNIASHLQ